MAGPAPNRLISFASAKGGLGTTILAANLGIQLAKKGRNVLLVDGALTEASCHLALGMSRPDIHIGTLVRKEVQHLEEAIVPTPVTNLSLIAGAPDDPEVASMPYLVKQKLIQGLCLLPYDYVLIDAGAGSGTSTLDFYLTASYPILVCQPSAATLDAFYRFIRAMLHRLLQDSLNKKRYRALFRGLPKASPLEGLWDMEEARRDELDAVESRIRERRFCFVLTGLQSEKEAKVGKQVEFLLRRYFLFPMRYLGWIEWDSQAAAASRALEAISKAYPMCPFSMATERLANILLRDEKEPLIDEGKLQSRSPKDMNAYELLEIPFDASIKDIQAAYARLLEPYMDSSLIAIGLYGEEEREVIQDRLEWAYKVLISTGQRRRYDEELVEQGVMEPSQRVDEYPEATLDGILAWEAPVKDEPSEDEAAPPRKIQLEEVLNEVDRFTGEGIKKIREAQGISIEEIVSETKIRGSYIRAIEDEQFESLPELIYLKNFVKQIACYLGLDPRRVIEDYLEHYQAWYRKHSP